MAIKLIPVQYSPGARESWNEIIGDFWKNRVSRVLLLVLWTIVFWGVWFVAMFLCAMALEFDVSFVYFSACAVIAMVFSLLPITVAGVGTRDAAFILLLGSEAREPGTFQPDTGDIFGQLRGALSYLGDS